MLKTWLIIFTLVITQIVAGCGRDQDQTGPGQGMIQDLQAGNAGRTSSTFQGFDQNGNGFISHAEAALNPRLIGHWKQLDENSDGRLDPSEFSAMDWNQPASPNLAGNAKTH